MTAAELWERYRPKLDAARERDRREAAESLLRHPVLVSGIWLHRMTIERVLYLQALDHPIVTGGDLSKDDVYSLMWILSLNFKPCSPWAYRRFKLRFLFKRIAPVGEEISAWLRSELDSGEKENSAPPPADWVVTLIDALASQYGWKEQDILDLPVARAFKYGKAIHSRLSENHAGVTFSKHADAVREDYMREMRKLQKKEATHE